MNKIILYQLPGCPYCTKVRNKLEEMKLDYDIVDVENDRNDPVRQELLEKSNVPTVPVIQVDGEYIGESDIIIAYLEENKDTLKK